MDISNHAKTTVVEFNSVMIENAATAYIKPVLTDKGNGYGVFATDGNLLAAFSTRDAAFFAAIQNELEPVLLH